MRSLDNAVAVVTGAASGIGRATALALAAKRSALAIADIDEVGLAETARLLRERGVEPSVHIVDVADKQRMQAFAEAVAETHGRVNVVVNNAGVSVGAIFEASPACPGRARTARPSSPSAGSRSRWRSSSPTRTST